MATVLDVIKRAYRLYGGYSIGETPSADESQDALTALNSMLASWANEPQLAYVKALDVIPMTGSASYTLGETGTIITTRPQQIEPTSYLLIAGVSYPLQILTKEQYNAITSKDMASQSYALYYEATYPNGTLKTYPVGSTGTLYLNSIKSLPQYVNVTDDLNLPNGYEDAIAFNLSVLLAAESQVPVSNGILMMAKNFKRLLKRQNFEPSVLQVTETVHFNFYAG